MKCAPSSAQILQAILRKYLTSRAIPSSVAVTAKTGIQYWLPKSTKRVRLCTVCVSNSDPIKAPHRKRHHV
jgi:hypothetical protein